MFTFVSCGDSISEFKLQNSFYIKLQDSVHINTQDCLYFSSDSSLYQLFMYYTNVEMGNKILIDSVEFSPYKSMIYSYKLQDNDSYIVLWETEYEFYPQIYAYYITTEEEIIKIGELLISLPCQSCDNFEYPIENIKILKNKKNIEFSFLKDVNYKPKEGSVWQLYKAGALKCIYNTETNNLIHTTIHN